MAEPDLGGVGGASFGGGGANAAPNFRAATDVKINYKDVTGLVKEMTNLADAVKKVKEAIVSLDEPKVREALSNLSSATGGGGGSFGSGGGKATRGNGGGATFGGLSPGMTAVGVGLTAASLAANNAAGRKQSDLVSDVTSMRVMFSSAGQFSLNQANQWMLNNFSGSGFSRDDMNMAAQAVAGRYGTVSNNPGSPNGMAASTASALGGVSMQGATYGADLANALNNPVVLNRVRQRTGVPMSQFSSSTQASDMMTRLAYGTNSPTANQMNNFRPGMNQFDNMVYYAGGNVQLATTLNDEAKMKQLYLARGGAAAKWNDKTLGNLAHDKSAMKSLGIDNSLFLANERFQQGKSVTMEESLQLSRSNMVKTEEWLARIQQDTSGMYKALQQLVGPLGSFMGGMSSTLGHLGSLLTPLALLARGGGLPGAATTAAEAGSSVLAAATKPLVGGASLASGAIVTAGLLGGQYLDSKIGNPRTKKGFDIGNVLRYTAGGAAIGGVSGMGVFSAPAAAIGGVAGLTVGVAREALDLFPKIHLGDPVDDTKNPGSVGAMGGGPNMDLTSATDLLLSRNRSGNSDSVRKMSADLRLRLGRLFAQNPKLVINSGWRSMTKQKELHDLYKAGKGNKAAKPGSSLHEYGLAADIGPSSEYNWLAGHGGAAGLTAPVSGEPWHWEPPGAKSQRNGAPAAADDGGSSSIGGGSSSMFAASGLGPSGRIDYSDLQQMPSGAAPTLSGRALGAGVGGGGNGGTDTAGSNGNQVAWKGGGGAMSINEVARLARAAGLPESQVATAVAIAMAESSLNPNDHNSRPPDDSYGLWQINMLGKKGPERRKRYGIQSNAALFNPTTNAKAMFMESGAGGNWKPWTTWPTTYKKYMGAVNEALTTGVGDPVPSAPSRPSYTSTQVAAGGGRRGGGPNVYINVQIAQASDEEALRLARRVKAILEGDEAAIGQAREGAA